MLSLMFLFAYVVHIEYVVHKESLVLVFHNKLQVSCSMLKLNCDLEGDHTLVILFRIGIQGFIHVTFMLINMTHPINQPETFFFFLFHVVLQNTYTLSRWKNKL